MRNRGDPTVPAAVADHAVRPPTAPDHRDATPAARVLLMPSRELRLAKDPDRLRALARFTCWRCQWVMRSRVQRLLHTLQCRGAPEEHRARAAWSLAINLSFISTLWPKGTRLAGLLAGKGHVLARRSGYASVAAWLRGTVYRACFQTALAAIRTPTTHRRGRKRRRDAAGHVERVAPVDLPPEWFEWWVKKEVQRRAEPVLRDLLGADARIPRARAFRPVEESPDPQSTTDGVGAGEDADRIAALRRDLCRFCDPESSPLSYRERQLLALALEGYSTAEIRAALRFPTDQAVFAARSRLRKKLPRGLRAVLSPRRWSGTPI
jgi:hypothetical protein